MSKVAYGGEISGGNSKITERALTEVRNIYSTHDGDDSNAGSGDEVAEEDPETDGSDKTGKIES